jgi:hypothetical protein
MSVPTKAGAKFRGLQGVSAAAMKKFERMT